MADNPKTSDRPRLPTTGTAADLLRALADEIDARQSAGGAELEQIVYNATRRALEDWFGVPESTKSDRGMRTEPSDYMTVSEAAAIANCHPETIAQALRSTSLHGWQRGKRGLWRIERTCLDSWIIGVDCEHQLATVEGKRDPAPRR